MQKPQQKIHKTHQIYETRVYGKSLKIILISANLIENSYKVHAQLIKHTKPHQNYFAQKKPQNYNISRK